MDGPLNRMNRCKLRGAKRAIGEEMTDALVFPENCQEHAAQIATK
jgi:hypothetical protein